MEASSEERTVAEEYTFRWFSRLGLCAPAGPLAVPSVAVWSSPCTGKAARPTDPTLTAASPWPATPFAPQSGRAETEPRTSSPGQAAPATVSPATFHICSTVNTYHLPFPNRAASKALG
ncbi:hypothetical protein SRHO_G00305630 [Serrasalmus rhombeus]